MGLVGANWFAHFSKNLSLLKLKYHFIQSGFVTKIRTPLILKEKFQLNLKHIF